MAYNNRLESRNNSIPSSAIFKLALLPRPSSFKLEENIAFETLGLGLKNILYSIDLAWLKNVMRVDVYVPGSWFGEYDGRLNYVKGQITWYSFGANSFLLSFDTKPCSVRYSISYDDLGTLIKGCYGQYGKENHLFHHLHPPLVLTL